MLSLRGSLDDTGTGNGLEPMNAIHRLYPLLYHQSPVTDDRRRQRRPRAQSITPDARPRGQHGECHAGQLTTRTETMRARGPATRRVWRRIERGWAGNV